MQQKVEISNTTRKKKKSLPKIKLPTFICKNCESDKYNLTKIKEREGYKKYYIVCKLCGRDDIRKE